VAWHIPRRDHGSQYMGPLPNLNNGSTYGECTLCSPPRAEDLNFARMLSYYTRRGNTQWHPNLSKLRIARQRVTSPHGPLESSKLQAATSPFNRSRITGRGNTRNKVQQPSRTALRIPARRTSGGMPSQRSRHKRRHRDMWPFEADEIENNRLSVNDLYAFPPMHYLLKHYAN
jgi:hypothetical protein